MREVCDEKVVELLEQKLPDFFLRSKVEELTGGLFKAGSLSVLNREGKGPPQHWMGRKCVYDKKEFLSWLVDHYSSMEVFKNAAGCRAVRFREGREDCSGAEGSGAEGNRGQTEGPINL